MQHTTQQGIRTIMHPYLSRKCNTNDQALRYNRLYHSVITNTIQVGTVPRRVNWYAQFYPTQFGRSRVHPMKRKVDAHENLSLFFNRDGVTPKIVIYESK